MSLKVCALGLRGRRIELVVATLMFAAVMFPEEATADLIRVGGNKGWTSNVNYTIWAEGTQFYKGDWLYFLYDRKQMNVLEVNQTDYEGCISDQPLHNWTTGAGRDVVHLNETRLYYFISGKGYCFAGMKLVVNVVNAPSPAPPPISITSPGLLISSVFNGHIFFTVGVLFLLRI